jgi:hypothetical protein
MSVFASDAISHCYTKKRRRVWGGGREFGFSCCEAVFVDLGGDGESESVQLVRDPSVSPAPVHSREARSTSTSSASVSGLAAPLSRRSLSSARSSAFHRRSTVARSRTAIGVRSVRHALVVGGRRSYGGRHGCPELAVDAALHNSRGAPSRDAPDPSERQSFSAGPLFRRRDS